MMSILVGVLLMIGGVFELLDAYRIGQAADSALHQIFGATSATLGAVLLGCGALLCSSGYRNMSADRGNRELKALRKEIAALAEAVRPATKIDAPAAGETGGTRPRKIDEVTARHGKLVGSQIECQKCWKMNPVGIERCWNCNAAL